MTKKYIGKRIPRNEDPRLLTGQALFVDDVDIPGMLHAAFCAAITHMPGFAVSTYQQPASDRG